MSSKNKKGKRPPLWKRAAERDKAAALSGGGLKLVPKTYGGKTVAQVPGTIAGPKLPGFSFEKGAKGGWAFVKPEPKEKDKLKKKDESRAVGITQRLMALEEAWSQGSVSA